MKIKSPYFTEHHQSFRNEVQIFLAEKVLPHISDWEKNRQIPRDIWRAMGQAGYFGLHYPGSVGGSDKDIFYSVILLEELGRTGCTGFRVAMGVHAYMATSYIAQMGSEYLKQQYLRPAILGEKISALAMTEQQAGSDLSQLQTTAILDGDSYVLNGAKKYVANGTTADFIIVAVKTGQSSAVVKRGGVGISLFIVDANTEGLSAKKLENIGMHSSDTAELTFNNVRVPKANLIGSLNQGFYYLMQCLQLERLVAGILAIGGVDKCIDITWHYVSDRQAFNHKLSQFQTLRHRMADLVTSVESARALAYHTAWLYQHGELPIAECSMVKLIATELANRTVHECMQFHGAYGYQHENLISRMFRDAPAATIAGGASEIMRDIIAQMTLDERRLN